MVRGVLWVTRAKTNMAYKIIRRYKKTHSGILLDAAIKLTGTKIEKDYPQILRLIIVDVIRDGKV